MAERDPVDTEIEEIAALLSSFQPRPGQKFYQNMQTAPWRRVQPKSRAALDWLPNALESKRSRWFAAAALVLVLAVFTVIAAPDLPAMAQNLLRYLRPATSDQIAVPVRVPFPENAESFGSPQYFSLNLAQAEQIAGFDVSEFPAGETDMKFSGAHYDDGLNRVVSRYFGDTFTAYLSQRKLNAVDEYSQIGASAPVEIVQVRGRDGEYVSGGWKMEAESVQLLATVSSGTQVNVEAYWDAELPQQIMRWQESGFLYEILTVGDANLGKEDLIRMAERVK